MVFTDHTQQKCNDSERKQAEDVLRISEKRYRKAQAMGHVGNWEYDLQTGYFWGSDEAKRIYGFDSENADFSTDEVENCIPEKERVHQALVDLIERGKAYDLEFEIHPRNSAEPRIIASIAELQRDEHSGQLKVVGIIQDITERKQAEAALLKADRTNNFIDRIINVFLTSTDEESYGEALDIVLDVMESRFGIFGFIADNGDLMIPSLTREVWNVCQVPDKTIVFPPDTWGESLWGRALREKSSFFSNESLHVPEGHIPIDSFLCVPILFADKAIGLLSVANKNGDYCNEDKELLERLVTCIAPILNARQQRDREEQELQRTSEELDRKNSELEESQRVAQIGNWKWDACTDTIIWSDEYYRIYGLDPAFPAPGYQDHLKIYTPESAAQLDAAVTRAMHTGEPYALELELASHAGNRCIMAIGEAIRDENGKITGLRGTAQNITERKRVESQFMESVAYNRNLIEASLDPLVTIGLDGRITDVNCATESITGCSREELIGRDFSDYFTEPDRARAGYQQAFKEGMVRDFPLQVRHRDGHATSVMYNATLFRNQIGEIKGVFAAARDITEQKKLESQLYQAQKMEAIGQLSGGIAHDFNNILSVIIGFGSLLEMKMAADDPLHVNVTQILAAADRAANLTRSMLAFSRKQHMDVKPVSLNEIASGMEKMLRRLIHEDIELRISLTEGDLMVLADAGQIDQVFLNLTTNARDSMPDGGAITITTEVAELDKTFKKSHGYGEPGKYALITFADNGEGMDNEIRQRIFEPFFTTKEVGRGTGLGLSVCYGIIKQHNGYILCYSEPGRGTTFRIYLPLRQSTAKQEVSVAAMGTPVAGGTETILMAEDDAAVRSLISSILSESGYIVIEAEDGEEAVARFSERPKEIQLCLFDLIMPKKNGSLAFEEIRKISPDTKVLFMSGYQANISIQKGLLSEGVELIMKPVLPAELLKRVRAILDK